MDIPVLVVQPPTPTSKTQTIYAVLRPDGAISLRSLHRLPATAITRCAADHTQDWIDLQAAGYRLRPNPSDSGHAVGFAPFAKIRKSLYRHPPFPLLPSTPKYCSLITDHRFLSLSKD